MRALPCVRALTSGRAQPRIIFHSCNFFIAAVFIQQLIDFSDLRTDCRHKGRRPIAFFEGGSKVIRRCFEEGEPACQSTPAVKLLHRITLTNVPSMWAMTYSRALSEPSGHQKDQEEEADTYDWRRSTWLNSTKNGSADHHMLTSRAWAKKVVLLYCWRKTPRSRAEAERMSMSALSEGSSEATKCLWHL